MKKSGLAVVNIAFIFLWLSQLAYGFDSPVISGVTREEVTACLSEVKLHHIAAYPAIRQDKEKRWSKLEAEDKIGIHKPYHDRVLAAEGDLYLFAMPDENRNSIAGYSFPTKRSVLIHDIESVRKIIREDSVGDPWYGAVLCFLQYRLSLPKTSAASNGKPISKIERPVTDGASAASSGTHTAAGQDTQVKPAPAAPSGSTQTAERTLAELGALTGKSSQEALRMLTSVLTAAIGKTPNIVTALAGVNALTANSIQEALTILKPLLTDAAKKNPSATKALAALNALTADAPEDAVAVLITILADSTSKNPNVAKTLASLQSLPQSAPDVQSASSSGGPVITTPVSVDTATQIENEDESWKAIPTREGCRFVMHTGDFFLLMKTGNDASNNAPVTWSGRCTPGKLISGSGRLIYEFTFILPGLGTSQRMRTEMTGTATDGMFEGASENASFSDGNDFDDKTPPGTMVLENLGDARNPMPFFYRNGCSHDVDSENQISPETNYGCDVSEGAAFRKSLMGSRAGGTSAPRPAAVAAGTSASDGADSPIALGKLSRQQIAACAEDIKRKQVESQSWGGDVNATANRLGRFQKELFEGRCAGHPDAAKYLVGANKMLGDSGNVAGSGDTTSSLSEGYVDVQGATQCVGYYVVSDKPETRTSLRRFSFGIRNTCSFPIYIGFTGYSSERLTHRLFDYVGDLPRSSTGNRYWRPGDKLETVPFNILSNDSFHVKIDWACPTEEQATQITGKKIIHIAANKDRASCRARIYEPTSRGVAQ